MKVKVELAEFFRLLGADLMWTCHCGERAYLDRATDDLWALTCSNCNATIAVAESRS
jgi:hypothetical protein